MVYQKFTVHVSVLAFWNVVVDSRDLVFPPELKETWTVVWSLNVDIPLPNMETNKAFFFGGPQLIASP